MYKLVIIFILFSVSSFGQESDEVYGAGCGIMGTNPYLRDTIETWVMDRNAEKLTNWLYSDSYVKQTYAVEGLIRIQNEKHIHISKNAHFKIKKLKSSSKKISTCSGCTYYRIKIKDALHNFKWNWDNNN